MKHKINIKDLKNFVKEIELAGSYGRGENKSLVASVDVNTQTVKFIVYNNREIVAEPSFLESAIEYYNEI